MLTYYIITALAIGLILVLLQLQYENGFRKGILEQQRREQEKRDIKERTRVLSRAFKKKLIK